MRSSSDWGYRKIGRAKLRWSDVIQNGMKETGVQTEEPQYGRKWHENLMRRPQIGPRPKKKSCNTNQKELFVAESGGVCGE